MAGEVGSEQLDRMFECLSNRRRRYALASLRDHRSMTLADLADEVAVREQGRRIDEISAESVMHVYLSLYHTHVPKLEAAALAEYCQSDDTVATGEDLGQAASLISLVEEGT